MTEYIYQQTVVQWRIPITEEGKLGTPEVYKKFTTEFKGSQNKHQFTGKRVAEKKAEQKQKELELKEIKQNELRAKLQTTIGETKYI